MPDAKRDWPFLNTGIKYWIALSITMGKKLGVNCKKSNFALDWSNREIS